MSEQLKYKLLHFQQKPPKNSWDAISAALDDQHNSLSKKLYDYKESPLDSNWKQIEKELNEVSKEKAIVSPFFKKFNYKYLTAAVLILAVLITTFLLITNQSSTPENDIVRSTPVNENNFPVEEPVKNDVAVTEDPYTPNNNSVVNEPTPRRKNESIVNKEPTNNTRYTTLADEDGKLVRLSKKIFPVFDCAENSTAFLRKRCQENIESLQKQMASSIVSPAADFAGLLDMLKKLEENN